MKRLVSIFLSLVLLISSFGDALAGMLQAQGDPPDSKETTTLYVPMVFTPRVYTSYFPMILTPLPVAFFRSGQTFLTWPEQSGLQGEVYRIYRSNKPITPKNLRKAKLLAEVGKGSANFYENRYKDWDTGAWGIRYTDRMIINPGGGPVKPGWGLLVWTLAAEDFGGKNSGKGYYAIAVKPAGGKETFNPNMVAGPVLEAVADPQPIDITSPSIGIGPGGHVYIQYMDLRNWNATYGAPNASNAYYGLDPADPNLAHALQYAYDYVVYAPTPDLCGGDFPDKIPVFFHLHGWRDFTNPPADGYHKQDRFCAYGVYPVDVTNTWYFGFARDNDYRVRSEPKAGDVIVNYTEQRLLRMLYDLMRNPPGPAVDPQRVYVAGQSMGGTGSLAFAERYPNVFAAAYASQPMTNLLTAGVTDQDWIADASVKWGPPDLNLPVSISAPNGWANPLKDYNGTGVWDWQNLIDSATGTKLASRLGDDMALLGVVHGSKDSVVPFDEMAPPGVRSSIIPWDTQAQPFYEVFHTGGRPWGGLITKNDHQWEYYRGLPPFLADLGTPEVYRFKPFWDLQVVRDETVPGLSNLSGNSPVPPTKDGDIYNMTVTWSSSWDPWDGPPIDEPKQWQISLCSLDRDSLKCGSGVTQTVDVTPRRLQQFRIAPGKVYQWQNRLVKDNSVVASGTVKADSNGLITVTGFQVFPGGNRLLITPGE
jgi:pimeloyl-ACP methyl ester carboxylesterase